jgi:CMP-N,N'-diacetyllegionaminic acid synthase
MRFFLIKRHEKIMEKITVGEVLALIPARGGSKSVPRKNIIMLHGKPMIAWAIEHALQAKHVSRVIVTTDDDEIAEIAREYGAEVPFKRPSALALDHSLDLEFHRHAIEWLRDNEGYLPDMVMNLRPTPPSRQPGVLDRAIEAFAMHPNADSLRSVHLAEQSPFKMWKIDECGLMQPIVPTVGDDEPYNQPRQNLPPVYWQDGYVDITRPKVVLSKNSTSGRVILPFIITEPAADIDYPDEISKVEAQLRERDKKRKDLVDLPSVRHPS